jgi:hypothetical protein
LHNLSRVLLQVGSSENANSPTFIGCSEIENRGVLEDLIKESNFVNKGMELSILIPLIRENRRGFTISKQYFRPTTYTNILIVYRKEAVKVDSKAEAEEKTDDTQINNRVFGRIFCRQVLGWKKKSGVSRGRKNQSRGRCYGRFK